jgi:tetratricopeptide (TPR) repeat protein
MVDTEFYEEALKALDIPVVAASEKDLRYLEILACAKTGLGENVDEYIDSMLETDGAYAPALNLKALNIYRQGNIDAAESLFQQAITSDPGYGKSYTNLGVLKWTADRRDEAIGYLEKGFILSPTITNCLNMYHSAITELELYAKAEDIVRETKTLHPYNKNIAFFYIDILIKQNKYEKAMEEIEKAMV